jgi:hypothetical protein
MQEPWTGPCSHQPQSFTNSTSRRTHPKLSKYVLSLGDHSPIISNLPLLLDIGDSSRILPAKDAFLRKAKGGWGWGPLAQSLPNMNALIPALDGRMEGREGRREEEGRKGGREGGRGGRVGRKEESKKKEENHGTGSICKPRRMDWGTSGRWLLQMRGCLKISNTPDQ